MKRTSASLPVAPASITRSPTSDPTPDCPPSELHLLEEIQEALTACDTRRLKKALAARPDMSLHMNLNEGWNHQQIQNLVCSLPHASATRVLSLSGRFPDGVPSDVAAALLLHPNLHTLNLDKVSLTPRQYAALLNAAAQGMSTLRKLCFTNMSSQIFDPSLADLIQHLGQLESLELAIEEHDTDGVPVEQNGSCQLARVLQEKPLQNLALCDFKGDLGPLAQQWNNGPPPAWRSLSLNLINLALFDEDDEVEGLGQLLTGCIDNPHLRWLDLNGVYIHGESSSRATELLGLWQAPRRQAWMADVARAMRRRQTPLRVSLTSCGPVSMQILMCAFGASRPDTTAPDRPLAIRPAEQPVRCVDQLTVRVQPAADMPEPDPTGAPASQLLSLVRLLSAQVATFECLDTLSLELLAPNTDPAELSATERQALSGLSDALSNMPLTALSFHGPRLDPPPVELQDCLRITRQRLMHRQMQFDAAVSCIGWGGTGRTLPSELGRLILRHPQDNKGSLRQAALIPALDSASLLAVVDRYNDRVRKSNADPGVDEPDRMPLHPLSGLARSIRSRRDPAPTETVTGQ